MSFKFLAARVHYSIAIRAERVSSQLFQTGKRGDSSAPNFEIED
jgi:hypothetical protein